MSISTQLLNALRRQIQVNGVGLMGVILRNNTAVGFVNDGVYTLPTDFQAQFTTEKLVCKVRYQPTRTSYMFYVTMAV